MIFLWYYCMSFIALANGQDNVFPSRRVISGNIVESGEVPFIARFFYGHYPSCSGIIIHVRWILTAAHCIARGMPVDPVVLVGSTNSKTDNDGVYYYVEEEIRHEKYVHFPAIKNDGREYVTNDIALLRLKEPIQLNNKNIMTIPLAFNNENYTNTIVKLAGFGLNSRSDKSSSQLRSAIMRVIEEEKCRAVYYMVKDKQMCADVINEQVACYGDSGGPLFTQSGVVIGITSTIADESLCNPHAGPVLFTKVSSYESWIRDHMAAYGDELPSNPEIIY